MRTDDAVSSVTGRRPVRGPQPTFVDLRHRTDEFLTSENDARVPAPLFATVLRFHLPSTVLTRRGAEHLAWAAAAALCRVPGLMEALACPVFGGVRQLDSGA